MSDNFPILKTKRLILRLPEPSEAAEGLRYMQNNLTHSQIFRKGFQAAYLGYGIDHDKQRQGLMFEAISAALDYVFNDRNLHRIMANYMPTNERSGNLLKRLGFRVEGYAKDYLLINGSWRDHVLTSLTNANWHHPEEI